MNCANCDEEIYWDHEFELWQHLDGINARYCKNSFFGHESAQTAEPKIDEPKTYCKHCGVSIMLGNSVYGLKTGIWYHKTKDGRFPYYTIYCNNLMTNYDRAEPKDDLIILDEVKAEPTDCIKCDQIRYKGTTPHFADKAVCCIGRNSSDSVWLLWIFNSKIPDSYVPPDWCPLKTKEPEDLCLAIFGNPIVVCQLSKGHAGKHEGRRRDLIYSWNDYDSESLGKLMKNTPSDLDTKPDTSSLEIRPMPQPNMQKGETIDKVADLLDWIDELRQMIGKYGYDIVAKKG